MRILSVFLSVFLFFVAVTVSAEEKKLNIAATQTIFADLVEQVGQDRVNVTAIASPKYNVHFYQPRPSDVRKVSRADLYVCAGLDLEAWSDPLLEAAGRPRLFRNGSGYVDLSSEVSLLNVPQGPVHRGQGDIHLFGNPHFHMNPENADKMAKTIAAKLSETDPEHAAYYQKNATVFLEKLEEKIEEWKSMCAHCAGQQIVSYHDDIAYFADFLGLKAEQFIEPKPGIPPTPKHFKFLEEFGREHRVKAVVLPSYYSSGAADQLAERIGAQVVLIAQAPGELPKTEDFFRFFDENIRRISEALR